MVTRTLHFFFILVIINIHHLGYGQNSTTSSSATSYTAATQNNASIWNNLNNLQSSDNQFAYTLITGNKTVTNNIDAVGWGFQTSNASLPYYIPSNATINGIEVTVKLRKSLSGNVKEYKITVLKDGSETVNRARTSVSWPSTATNVVYGSSVDMWGTTWTAADIIKSGFGVRISGRQRGKKNVQAEIDHIKITVYYNQKFFYSKSSGNLESLSNWGTVTNGSGSAPANFTTDGQVFFLRNRTAVSLTGDLNITGINSKMVIGDGTNATHLTIPANYALSATVDLAANSSLTVSNTTTPTLKTVASNTTVTYNAAGNQTISDVSFYNLTLGGSGNKLISTNVAALTVVSNVLTINSDVILNNQGNQVLVSGTSNGIVNNGTATGAGNYTYEIVDGNTVISGNGTYNNLEIDAVATNNGTSRITLNNPTVVTGMLKLAEGEFANGSNLIMASGSQIKVVDGKLLSDLTPASIYDLIYAFESSTTKVSTGELSGTVGNINIQIPNGTTLSLDRNLNITKNLLISSGTFDATSNGYNIAIGGNFTNNANFTTGNSTVTFNGNAAQTINSTSGQTFYNLVVNNAAGGSLQLNTPVSVSNSLTLTNGIVTSSSANPISISSAASISGGSVHSYIAGPLKQTLAAINGTKTFPIGQSGAYKPVVLALQQLTSTPTTYTGEVIDGAPTARILPSTLKNITGTRYYSIHSSNNANISSAVVSLTYDASDNVPDYTTVRIAKSFGTEWLNIGGTASAAGSGTITSSSFSSFSDFAFATEMNLALPLTWVSFNGVKKSNSIELAWETASEVNTSHFLIERSSDSKNWKTIATVKSKDNEDNNYLSADMAPLPLNYYRIKQVDLDGKFSYSKVIMIQYNTENKPFAVQPNPVTGGRFNCLISDAAILASKEVIIKVYDMAGKEVFTAIATPAINLPVECNTLKPGIYVVQLQGTNKTQQTKVLVR